MKCACLVILLQVVLPNSMPRFQARDLFGNMKAIAGLAI